MSEPDAPAKGPRGIQSAGVAVRILQVFGDCQGPLHLREIAAAAEVHASNAYRYLVSFCEVGMVRQQLDGRYDLGPLAIRLGLAALNRLDEFKVVTGELDRLVATTGLDAHVSLWGTAGPTVARWCGWGGELSIQVREGTVFSLTSSATGRAWAAFHNPAKLAPILDAEFERVSRSNGRPEADLRAEHEAHMEKIRADGIAASRGERRPGVGALSGPIRDRNGEMIFSFTLLGLETSFEDHPNGKLTAALREALLNTSIALGAPQLALENKLGTAKV